MHEINNLHNIMCVILHPSSKSSQKKCGANTETQEAKTIVMNIKWQLKTDKHLKLAIIHFRLRH